MDETKKRFFADWWQIPNDVRNRMTHELSSIKGAIPIMLTMVDSEVSEDEASAFRKMYHGKEYPAIEFDIELSARRWKVVVSYDT